MRGELEQCKKEFERYLDYMDSVRQAFPDDAIKILTMLNIAYRRGLKCWGKKNQLKK